MQRPLQITFRGIEHSDALETAVRKRAAELERFSDDITTCRVTIEAPHHRHHKGNLYTIHLEVHLPDDGFVVKRERRHDHAHEDAYVTIRDAFDAATRKLEDYARRRRGQIKAHEPATLGRVTRLFPQDGYGFAQLPDGTDVYFHENSVAGTRFSSLRIGDEVRIVVAEGEGEKGPQASTIVPTGRRRAFGEQAS